jgi:energy-coupling factor transporter ATP-binding protein EcfA2
MDFDQPITLFMGANGSGKTSVFEVLREIHKFVVINNRLDDKNDPAFQTSTLTRWLDESVQRFNLDVASSEGIYRYSLEIEHDLDRRQARVKTEQLFLNNQPLYEFTIAYENGIPIGTGKLYNDNPKKQGIPYSIDWFRSGLGTITERHDNKKLIFFKNWLENLFVIQIIPSAICADFTKEESYPEQNMSNFSAWLNYWNNENREGLAQVEESLKQIIRDFSSFKFTQAGTRKTLEIKLSSKYTLNFTELSDGQKALAALYTLVYCAPEGSTVCIDEPDNFLALPEIQPWLDALSDNYQENKIQALLISHHPGLINFLAPNSGYWFSRQESHSRALRVTHDADGGLSFAELVNLGWIYEP